MRVCPQCGLKYPDDQDICFVDRATLEEAPDERIGTTIAGRYLLESKLGEGGMATVYRARHTLVDKPVAVKILGDHVARNPSMKERFRREAKNTAQLNHPHIVSIFDNGETEDGAAYLVMELLEGHALADIIAQGPMPPRQVAAIGLQIARGLARAHDFDVIHRDLKPENIFIQNGNPPIAKILDFGIARSMHDARLTSAGEIFGTPQYMAPERVTSIDAGHESDLYALGIILFEMVTGTLPFHSEEITGYFIAHLQQEPPRPSAMAPSCPPELEQLILSLMAKQPEGRPVDAHRVMEVLKPMAPDLPEFEVTAAPSSATPAPTLPPTTLERWARRAVLFDQMLRRAYPNGAPPEAESQLGLIRDSLNQIQGLRSTGLAAQRELEGVEREAQDARARLGRAVHTLAEDLSKAREAERKAKAWLEAKAAEVHDLDFQVKILREQLEKSEAHHDGLRARAESALVDGGRELEQREQRLMEISGSFCEGLRGRAELEDLFAQLAMESGR